MTLKGASRTYAKPTGEGSPLDGERIVTNNLDFTIDGVSPSSQFFQHQITSHLNRRTTNAESGPVLDQGMITNGHNRQWFMWKRRPRTDGTQDTLSETPNTPRGYSTRSDLRHYPFNVVRHLSNSNNSNSKLGLRRMDKRRRREVRKRSGNQRDGFRLLHRP